MYSNDFTSVSMKGAKGEKGDTGRGTVAGGGMDTSGFPAGFVEGPQGPPGRKVRRETDETVQGTKVCRKL